MSVSLIHRMVLVLLASLLAFIVLAQGASAQTAWSCNGQTATIVGTPGPDTLRGTAGADVIVGREGDDVITGLGGDDIVCAGKGDDQIFGGDGFDIIFAAQGDDIIYAANGATPSARSDTRGARMFGGAGNDIIHGSNRWDRMQGGLGRDQLFGYEGRDWMRAGPDNDLVDGGPAVDDLHGGNGRDTLELTDGDIVRGGAGLDLCNLANGEPGLLKSCGRNVREQPAAAPTPQPEPTPTPEPAPDPIAGFTYSEGDAAWTGRIYGLVPTQISEFSNEEGRCFLLVGELTPTALSEGVVSNGFSTPGLGVIAGGEYVTDGFGCDDEPAETLGYDWVLNAEALPGTTIPIFAHILIPTTNTGTITEIVVGQPQFGGDFITGTPVFLRNVPTPANLTVGPPAPAAALTPSAFEYIDSNTAEWDGRLLRVEEVPLSEFTSASGRCFLVLGELVPTKIDGLVSSGFTTPSIGGIASGRYIPDSFGCDTSAAEAQGFNWILNAEVTLGTTYKFYAAIFIPDSNSGVLDQIVVGPPTSSALVYNVR